MHRLSRTPGVSWLWRGLAVLAVMLGLVASQAAAYADSGPSTITLYAQQAPAAAWVSVEYQDPGGGWHAVDGWQGSLDTLDSVRLKQWTVAPENAGQGPFRWVVYTEQGGSVWATSDSFYLPGGTGANLTMTIDTPQAGAASVAPTATPVPAPAASAVIADSTTIGMVCDGDCGYSVISIYLPDAPAGSTVGVQWQDGNGDWHNVDGWQGAVQPDANGAQAVHWGVAPDNYGQGPFRWVVTQPDGSLWGVSPNFNLPATSGLDYTLTLHH